MMNDMDETKIELLWYRRKGPGQLECELDLGRVLPTEKERERFEARWEEFLASDPDNSFIYRRKRDRLIYVTEQLIPTKTDGRPPLLLVLGNPASHSIRAGMFFSFEADGREHRFWKDILKPANIFDPGVDQGLSVHEQNLRRRDCILNLDYHSPFRIALIVFISLPSAASGPWSGIAGVQKLIGKKGMKRLEIAERERIIECARQFLTNDGAVIAFQKNAWNALKSAPEPQYRLDAAMSGRLKGTLIGRSGIPLYGVPPTRLAGPCRKILSRFLYQRYGAL